MPTPSLYQRSLESPEPAQVVGQYVWGARPSHRDELVFRERDTNGDGVLDDRLYCLMDYYNPVAVVDTTGEVKERYAWSAFGLRSVMAPNWAPRAGSLFAWSFAFHGQFLDNETGYYDYGYRYYSPSLGRWISRDPIGERGDTALYRYCANNSVKINDLLGREWTEEYQGEDYWSAYILARPTSPGAFSVVKQWRGATGIVSRKEIEPQFEESTRFPGCWCVTEGTGVFDVNVKYWGLKSGYPNLTASEIAKIKSGELTFAPYNPNGEPPISEALAHYGSWHEHTEVALLKQLYFRSIGFSANLAKSRWCETGSVAGSSRESLAETLSWEKAKELFNSQAKSGSEFDKLFSLEGSPFSPTPINPISAFDANYFDQWYKPNWFFEGTGIDLPSDLMNRGWQNGWPGN